MAEYHRKTTLNLRVTDEEKESITEKSDTYGVSIADYVTFCIEYAEKQDINIEAFEDFLLKRHFGLRRNMKKKARKSA